MAGINFFRMLILAVLLAGCGPREPEVKKLEPKADRLPPKPTTAK